MKFSLAGRLAFDWILASLTIILLGLRLWLHYRPRARLNRTRYSLPRAISDGLLSFITVVYLVLVVSMTLKRRELEQDRSRAQHETYAAKLIKLGPIQGIGYCIGLWFIKGSFIAFYFSLKRYITSTYKKVLIVGTVVTVCTFLTAFLTQMLWCRPFKRAYTPGPDYCSINIDFVPATILSMCNIVTDLMIMGLGLGLLVGLQLGRRQQAALAFNVLVGTMPIIASVLRYAAIYSYLKANMSYDEKWDKMTIVEVWSTIDMSFAIYAACLPALRAFIRSKRPARRHDGDESTFGGTMESGSRAKLCREKDSMGSTFTGDLREIDVTTVITIDKETDQSQGLGPQIHVQSAGPMATYPSNPRRTYDRHGNFGSLGGDNFEMKAYAAAVGGKPSAF